MPVLKGVARRAAEALGVEEQARRARRALDDRVTRRNRRDDEHLKVVVAATLAPNSNCIDVGANLGGVLETITRCAPDGEHYAFEPLPALASDLQLTFPNVRVRQAALAKEPGRASFNYVPSEPGLSGFSEGKAAGLPREVIDVEVSTLDAEIPPSRKIALIKIDVEGAELGVLEGAARVLDEHHPVIVLEHSRDLAPKFGTTAKDVHDLLTGYGYRIFDMDGDGPFDLERFEAASASNERFNWLARI